MDVLNIKSRSSIYKLIRSDPEFPRPISILGKRQFFLDEVEAYVETRKRRQYTAPTA
jgi:predicted DNA-binding transcriptional regulator AlpA